ncbi:Uncharacterized protein APZ42_031821 [Daphnia magna]|uniref:Uncharacterized protein n=1 Tax=Daphnia magna TaxID=35525 RepID=A0A164MI26_9CRUS|nr:Uncharacterized protein APZ42_031821 [Daphnia magna]
MVVEVTTLMLAMLLLMPASIVLKMTTRQGIVFKSIVRCPVNSLLKLLKIDGGLGYLPADWRTLSKTQLSRGKVSFRDVPPRRYVHLGLANRIILSLFKIDAANLLMLSK